jgi:hypothetical protein
MRFIGGIVVIVYLLVGVVIANNHHYLADLHGVNAIVSAILAVILWPLILLGVSLHIGGGGNKKQGIVVVLPVVRALAARRDRRTGVAA